MSSDRGALENMLDNHEPEINNKQLETQHTPSPEREEDSVHVLPRTGAPIEPSTRVLSVRLTLEEFEELERYRADLQEQFGSSVKVTQRTVVIEALKQLGRAQKRKRTH